MRFLRILFLFILFLVPIFPANSFETERYVSPRGNDGWPGTQARPWKTLEYAIGQILAGEGDVRLVLLDGDYYGNTQFCNTLLPQREDDREGSF